MLLKHGKRSVVTGLAILASVGFAAGKLPDIDEGVKFVIGARALSSDPEWISLSEPGVYIEEVELLPGGARTPLWAS